MQHAPTIFRGVRPQEARGAARRHSRAFTLVELLIVIGILVLLMAVAVPIFRALTGDRSLEQGTNILSATLARVRNEAIGLHQHRGLMFYLDPNTGRVAMATLAEVPQVPATFVIPADVWLDIDGNAETVLLPSGVGVQTLIDGQLNGAGVRTGNGYIGMNNAGMFAVRVGGTIVFDPDGTLYVDRPGMYWGPVTNPSNLAQLLFNGPAPVEGSGWGLANVGVCMFDMDQYASNFGGESAWEDNQVPAQYASQEKPKEDWLDNNAVPLIVNRYNGTLIKGE